MPSSVLFPIQVPMKLPQISPAVHCIFGSRFLISNQELRWSAAPNARCCGGQGLPPPASGRLDGPVLTGTRRWTTQPRWKSTGGPVIYGKPLRRRNAAAILASIRLGFNALNSAGLVHVATAVCASASGWWRGCADPQNLHTGTLIVVRTNSQLSARRLVVRVSPAVVSIRSQFLRIFGSRFLSSNQELRWVQHQMRVVAVVRGCLHQRRGV